MRRNCQKPYPLELRIDPARRHNNSSNNRKFFFYDTHFCFSFRTNYYNNNTYFNQKQNFNKSLPLL